MTEFSKVAKQRVETLERALTRAGANVGVAGEFKIVKCDGCGKVSPIEKAKGWTSEGSAQTGWTDLCRRCSQ